MLEIGLTLGRTPYGWVLIEALVVTAVLTGLMQVASRIVLGEAVEFMDAAKITFVAVVMTRITILVGGDPLREPVAMTSVGMGVALLVGLVGFKIEFDQGVGDTIKATAIFVALTAVVEFIVASIVSVTGTWA